MDEHKLALTGHAPLSLITVHEDLEGNSLDLNTVCVMDQANKRCSGEFLEAWYSSTNSINKHKELDQIYDLL